MIWNAFGVRTRGASPPGPAVGCRAVRPPIPDLRKLALRLFDDLLFDMLGPRIRQVPELLDDRFVERRRLVPSGLPGASHDRCQGEHRLAPDQPIAVLEQDHTEVRLVLAG